MSGLPAVDPWIAMALAVFVFAVLALTLFARRELRPAASTDQKLNDLNARVARAEEKISSTDHDVRNIRMVVNNLPTKESISAIGNQVAETRGQIGGMQTLLTTNSRALDRIEDFLLKAAGDAIVGAKPARGADGDKT